MYNSKVRTRNLARWLGILASAAAFVASAHAHAGTITWGVNGHPFTAYPGISFAEQLDLVRGLGTTTYRVNVSDLAQTRALGELVAEARDRGIAILPVLTPGVDLDRDTPERLYATAFNFAAAFAGRFKSDIHVWELGNELENYAILQPCETQDDGKIYPCSNGPAGGMTPLEYHGARWRKVAAVLKGMSDGVMSVDPTLQKAIGTAGWGHRGAFERMRDDKIAWDVTVWHAYREETEDTFQFLAGFGKPIWVTEFNHPEGSTAGPEAQARGIETIMRGIDKLRDRYRIEGAFVYELLDEPYWQQSFEGVMGLVELSETPNGWTVTARKPAFDAVRRVIVEASDAPVR